MQSSETSATHGSELWLNFNPHNKVQCKHNTVEVFEVPVHGRDRRRPPPSPHAAYPAPAPARRAAPPPALRHPRRTTTHCLRLLLQVLFLQGKYCFHLPLSLRDSNEGYSELLLPSTLHNENIIYSLTTLYFIFGFNIVFYYYIYILIFGSPTKDCDNEKLL